ncbi:GreA/GreB family elongation factor [Allomuricauda ruestringensis DSM 13258]|uniref:GreA/GreB family elongation factor n=1 Tax=Allomuricauda ruestringensis (strain DSM 13258 / CIP 107369 / LMG 19739 / B1) TaxID=886377 RepID=G2PP77_ALLRU|nr:GreA/GreB family elongation factor [Allomuricauda ruestringensis]AEM70329.1 GreA/GreB family elongation factor [Allomuricauda ruestringensis DSM 13258]
MKYGSLIMEKKDYVTLKRILNFHRYYEDYAHKDALEQLGDRIDKALVEDELDIPDDVVRLNSKVTVEFVNGARQMFQLVPSTRGDLKNNMISVVSTMGASLVGLAVDDTVQIGAPSDSKSFKIVDVEQSHQLSSSFDF